MAKKCNIEKDKKCREKYFKQIITLASNKELKEMKKDLDKEIRLSETAIEEGFERRK